MPTNYNDPDRPWWLPKRPPPRIPDAVMHLFPVAKPPKRPRTTWLDYVSYALGLILLAGLYAATRSGAHSLAVSLEVVFWVVGAFALWRAFLCVVHEQQLCDWLNQRPDADDVPDEERPNG